MPLLCSTVYVSREGLSLMNSCIQPLPQAPFMESPVTTREPCPDRILDDTGGAFAIGAVGGSALQFIKGVINSPRGTRLLGGTQAVRMNAPRIGGRFAVWGGVFSAFDCTMVYVRQKEDPWNSIIAGASTGLLDIRKGLGATARSALFGGVLLALIEGAQIMINKVLDAPPGPPTVDEPISSMVGLPGLFPGQILAPLPSTGAGASPSGWDSDSRSAGKKQKGAVSHNRAQTEVLESFDMPTSSLEYK